MKTTFIRFFCVKILYQRLLEIPGEKENIWRKCQYKLMYICARCGEDFSYVVLLVSLNAYILFTESFLVITFINKLLYEFMILPDFCQFDVKNEPAGFRPDRTGWKKFVRFQLWAKVHFTITPILTVHLQLKILPLIFFSLKTFRLFDTIPLGWLARKIRRSPKGKILDFLMLYYALIGL